MTEPAANLEARRSRLLIAQEGLLASASALSEVLEQTVKEIDAGRAHIATGGRAAELPDVAGTPTVNSAINDAISRFEAARQATRIEMFSLAWDEGLSFEDIAQAWGISRQRVSQIMNAAGYRSVKRPNRS